LSAIRLAQFAAAMRALRQRSRYAGFAPTHEAEAKDSVLPVTCLSPLGAFATANHDTQAKETHPEQGNGAGLRNGIHYPKSHLL
jgi:hypothetical protein